MKFYDNVKIFTQELHLASMQERSEMLDFALEVCDALIIFHFKEYFYFKGHRTIVSCVIFWLQVCLCGSYDSAVN